MRGIGGVLLVLALALAAGCGGKPPAPSVATAAPVPLSIRRPDPHAMAFAAGDEIPPVSFAFEGAPGTVRVTMEVEGISVTPRPGVTTINDVLFRAEGPGRIGIGFRKPWPGHPEGRVTIRCESGDERSRAEFEPELWFGHPAALVTFESTVGEPSDPVAEGREIVLARYVARNLPRDLRLTLKAVFTRGPTPPRVKAGSRPPR